MAGASPVMVVGKWNSQVVEWLVVWMLLVGVRTVDCKK